MFVYISLVLFVLLKSPFPRKDFKSCKASVEEVVYLGQLRDSEFFSLGQQKAQELKNTGKFRGINFKNNIKKLDLQNLLTYERCNLTKMGTLYCLFSDIYQAESWRITCLG